MLWEKPPTLWIWGKKYLKKGTVAQLRGESRLLLCPHKTKLVEMYFHWRALVQVSWKTITQNESLTSETNPPAEDVYSKCTKIIKQLTSAAPQFRSDTVWFEQHPCNAKQNTFTQRVKASLVACKLSYTSVYPWSQINILPANNKQKEQNN